MLGQLCNIYVTLLIPIFHDNVGSFAETHDVTSVTFCNELALNVHLILNYRKI
jgi:hypothetical protein